jgi:hypothetical protein
MQNREVEPCPSFGSKPPHLSERISPPTASSGTNPKVNGRHPNQNARAVLVRWGRRSKQTSRPSASSRFALTFLGSSSLAFWAMAYEQQIAKLEKHAVAFTKELEWIIQCAELVQPTIKDHDLINEFLRNNPRTIGFLIRRSVARYCIIGITRLTYDRQSQNPTARKLIAALTCTGADQLRKELKSAFTYPGAQSDPTFDEDISKLKDRWQWFSEHETEFVGFRDHRLAHIDMTKSDTEIKPLEWDLITEALRRLIEIAKVLSAILRTESRNFDQFQTLAQKDAKNFWQI